MTPAHPETGRPWPPMPDALVAIVERALPIIRHPPEACLINFYGPAAKMGLHQDRDEADFAAPVVSLSLGDSCLFRVGGLKRGDPTRSFRLNSGDVVRSWWRRPACLPWRRPHLSRHVDLARGRRTDQSDHAAGDAPATDSRAATAPRSNSPGPAMTMIRNTMTRDADDRRYCGSGFRRRGLGESGAGRRCGFSNRFPYRARAAAGHDAKHEFRRIRRSREQRRDSSLRRFPAEAFSALDKSMVPDTLKKQGIDSARTDGGRRRHGLSADRQASRGRDIL